MLVGFLRKSCLSFFFLVGPSWLVSPSFATSIVILRGPHQVYVGADSQRTYWREGGSYHASVCKIVTAGNLAFVASGVTVVGDTQVSNIGLETCLRSPNVATAIDSFRLKMLDYLPTALVARTPSSLQSGNTQSNLVLEAAFASVKNANSETITSEEANDSTVAVEWFRTASHSASRKVLSDRRTYGRPLYGRYEYIFLGQRRAIDRYLARNSTSVHSDDDARRLINFLIGLEIADTPAATAGPVDILKLTSSGSVWLQHKTGCN